MFRHQALRPLSRQHHNGLALCVMAGRALERRGDAAVEHWAVRVVERFDVELVNHFEAEEEVLFPAVRQVPGGNEAVEELIVEHREMERLAEKLRAEASRAVLEEFLDLLKRHIRREESELFEMAQERLPAGALEAMGEPLQTRVVEICLTVDEEES